MNVFNRIVMILGIFIWIVFLVVLLVVLFTQPQTILDLASRAVTAVEAALFDDYVFLYTWVGIAVAIAVLLILLVLELWRRRRKTVRVRQVGSADAQLSINSIAQNLRHQVGALSGVVRVKPRVISTGRSVDLILDLETSPDVHVPSKTDQACQVARTVVEEKLGVKLRKITANIRQSPVPKGAKEPTPLEEPSPTVVTVEQEPSPTEMPEEELYEPPLETVDEESADLWEDVQDEAPDYPVPAESEDEPLDTLPDVEEIPSPEVE